MSYEIHPVLAGVIPFYERFMTEWESLRRTRPRVARHIDRGMEVAIKYYKRFDNTTAYIIAMCEYYPSYSSLHALLPIYQISIQQFV
jgi:hypothetical protein